MTDTAAWKKARSTGNWAKAMKTWSPVLHRNFLGLVAATTSRGKLTEKLKHLIWTAVDSVATHLYAPGAALHAEESLAHGASVGEVMDSLRIAGLPLDRGLQVGWSVLAQATGKDPAGMSAEFRRAYDAFATSVTPGGLNEHDRCLVALAVWSCPAVCDRGQIEKCVKEAQRLGIDSEAMLEAMELASLIGVHSFSSGLDRMTEAFERHAGKAS